MCELVTGVQTCALPISPRSSAAPFAGRHSLLMSLHARSMAAPTSCLASRASRSASRDALSMAAPSRSDPSPIALPAASRPRSILSPARSTVLPTSLPIAEPAFSRLSAAFSEQADAPSVASADMAARNFVRMDSPLSCLQHRVISAPAAIRLRDGPSPAAQAEHHGPVLIGDQPLQHAPESGDGALPRLGVGGGHLFPQRAEQLRLQRAAGDRKRVV